MDGFLQVNPQAVRSKFDARLHYLVIAAAQYAAPALTVLLSLALFVHMGSGGGSGDIGGGEGGEGEMAGIGNGESLGGGNPGGAIGGGSVGEWGEGDGQLGACDAARWAVGAQPWKAVAVVAAAAAGGLGVGGGEGDGVAEKAGWEGLAGAVLNIPGVPEAFWTGITGFFAWWACFSWAVTYAMGVVFWRFCPEEMSVEEKERRDRTTKAKREKGKGKGKAKARGGGGGTKAAHGTGASSAS